MSTGTAVDPFVPVLLYVTFTTSLVTEYVVAVISKNITSNAFLSGVPIVTAVYNRSSQPFVMTTCV
jgi:hypothetical protein